MPEKLLEDPPSSRFKRLLNAVLSYISYSGIRDRRISDAATSVCLFPSHCVGITIDVCDNCNTLPSNI